MEAITATNERNTVPRSVFTKEIIVKDFGMAVAGILAGLSILVVLFDATTAIYIIGAAIFTLIASK